MDELKSFIFLRIKEELKARKLSIKSFAKQIGRSETWLHNKFKERSKFTFKDLDLITKGLGVSQFDLLPNKMKFDIDRMSLTEIITTICRKEIREYLKDNCNQNK